MDFICDTLVPVFFTVVFAWMSCTVISLAWLAREFRRDMRREDEEAIANRKGNR